MLLIYIFVPMFTRIKSQIPNFFTCLNLLCGCLAVISAFEGSLTGSAYLIGVALVMDFLDGFMARLLKVSSDLGKQLDSLADMVTFGFAPGIILFKMLNLALFIGSINQIGQVANFHLLNPLAYMALLIPIFSALRLAKFNIDTRQTHSFIGLPTPASALLIASLPLIIHLQHTNILTLAGKFSANNLPDFAVAGQGNNIQSMIRMLLLDYSVSDNVAKLVLSPSLLIVLTLLLSLLMVAELPLIALKFKDFSWSANKLRFILLIVSLLLLILFQYAAIPIIILLYIVLSAINNRSIIAATATTNH